ncbi:MAG: peptidase S58 family protein [Geminicoccaceae bacterium]|nr:MAG: peptidase S58 family protein [Geminicoccaceae bacterium]
MTLRPGPRNALTDVAGLTVGQAEDGVLPTGVTVVVADRPVVAAVEQRGGAPGSRELALMAAENLVERIDAVVLAGGSAFGLAAADAVMDALAADGRGFVAGPARVPIVPALVLFDLKLGPPERSTALYAALGTAAYAARDLDVARGSVGAGRGATCGGLKGGIGTASVVDPVTAATVAALVAVNAGGSAVIPGTGTLWAWPFELAGEMGGQRPPAGPIDTTPGAPGFLGGNTTLVVVATDATLDRPAAKRLAMMADDGLTRALRPAHTPFDGDAVIALSTGAGPAVDKFGLARLGTLAGDVVARAIGRAVFEAAGVAGYPGYRERHRPDIQR